MISGESIIQKSSGLLSTSIDKEVVILGIKSGNYFGFNEIGSDIWDMIETPIKTEKLIEELRIKYSDKESDIQKDVIDFLNELLKNNLIEMVDENHL